MHVLLAVAVLVVSGAGALAWWRFRTYVTHYGHDVVALLRDILAELRRDDRADGD